MFQLSLRHYVLRIRKRDHENKIVRPQRANNLQEKTNYKF